MNSIKKLIGYLVVILLFSYNLNGQNKYTKGSDSDKDALEVLSKSKAILNNAKSLIFDYTYISRVPEAEPTMQSGIAKQAGIKYYLEIGDRTLYCDGESIMVYSNTQNELQINDFDDEATMQTPADILNSFDTANYIFVIKENMGKNNKKYFNLLLKPLDRYSEYTKIEALIDKKTFMLKSITMNFKDGTKNIIKINSVKLDENIENSVFKFNKADFPGVSIEDLRMN